MTMCSYHNSSFLKKHRSIETAVIFGCMMLIQNLLSHGRKKIDVHMIFFLFLYSRFNRHSKFSSRNIKDANSYMFSWCITTSSLLICSWHYATLSQFAQEMYSIYSKSLLFTSISYVQESFKLNKVNLG